MRAIPRAVQKALSEDLQIYTKTKDQTSHRVACFKPLGMSQRAKPHRTQKRAARMPGTRPVFSARSDVGLLLAQALCVHLPMAVHIALTQSCAAPATDALSK